MNNEYSMAATPEKSSHNAYIIALCEAISPFDDVVLEEEKRAAVLERVAGFVQGELESIPRPAQMAFFLGMWCFRTWVLLRYGRGFLGLRPAKRRAAVAAWTWGRLALARQLFRVVRSTAFLAFYDDREVRAAVEHAAVPEAAAGEP